MPTALSPDQAVVAKSDQVGVPCGFVRVYQSDGIKPGPGGIHLQCDIGISGALFSGFRLGSQVSGFGLGVQNKV